MKFGINQRPKTKDRNPIDWNKVNRVLVVRLRSIGDTVLATPCLIALKRFLPEAQIDILLEDWVAPVLQGFDAVDKVLTVSRDGKKSRFETVAKLRRNRYDAAFNLHGGTTATFFVRASGARHRVGYKSYQYNFLYNHLSPDSREFWQQEHIHSAEHQLGLLGFAGIPVSDRPKSRLVVTEQALKSLAEKFNAKAQRHKGAKILSERSAFSVQRSAFALLHPTAAFESKQWATENFARVAEFLHEKGLNIIAIATPNERKVLANLKQNSRVPIAIFDDLTLPEITALASKAKIFVGNDSGIAHIVAAVETPTVVIFGSSNTHHWRPWTNAPNEIVYSSEEFDKSESIKRITVENVIEAAEKLLNQTFIS